MVQDRAPLVSGSRISDPFVERRAEDEVWAVIVSGSASPSMQHSAFTITLSASRCSGERLA